MYINAGQSGETNLVTEIGGLLKVSNLQTEIGRISTLSVQALASAGGISAFSFVSGDSLEANSLSLGGKSCTDLIKSASVSGNTLTLTYLKGGTVTFSKATTLTGAWSSGVFTASATGVTPLTTSITGGTGTWSGKTVTIPIYATIGSSATAYNTGKSVTATYSGTSDYNDGWNDALNACGIPNGGTVYTGNWEGTLFRAAYVGATAYAEVQNCISGVRNHQVQPKS